jgi:hypothetical protein
MNTDSGVVQRELDSGERLLWTGRPNPESAAAGSWGGVFVGGIMIAFAIFWMGGASQAGAPPFFSAFGLIFIGAGLYAMASPFLTMSSASNTIYAITDRRILVIEDGATRKVQSYTADDIEHIERREKTDGSGDIIFARERYQRHHNGHSHTHTRDIGLWGVPNAREVERLLRENLKRD